MRINKRMKADAVGNLTEETFKEREAALDTRAKEFGDRLYRMLIPLGTIVPPAFVSCDSSSASVEFRELGTVSFRMSVPRPVGFFCRLACTLSVDLQAILYSEYNQLKADSKEIRAQRREFSCRVENAIKDITTDKALRETFPEVWQHMHIPAETPTLPAAPPFDLTAAIKKARSEKP